MQLISAALVVAVEQNYFGPDLVLVPSGKMLGASEAN
jgi:hypothetical protein